MALKANKKIILCKVETAYGVDATPVVGTDALLAFNVQPTPVNIRYVERNAAVPFFGNHGQINVGETMQLEYDIELAGAGGVAVIPGYASALRGCAMAETITPSTGPVTYSLVSGGEESVTQYFYFEDQLHKLLGCYGTMELRFAEGQVPMAHFTWEGLYGGITTSAPGSPVLSAFQQAKAMTKANTTFTIHGYAAPLASMTITQNNQREYKNRPNSEKIHFNGRSSTGQVNIELPKIAVKDFVAICRAETTGTIALTHGTTAGNKVLFSAGQVQLTNPRYTEDANMAMLTMDMNLKYTDAGNDEWTLATQ